MNGRNALGCMLTAMLLLLVGGSGPVRGAQPVTPVEGTEADVSLAAGLSWERMEVDTAGDTGQHISVAIDPYPYYGGVYVSYYDADDKNLHMAHYLGSGGNCGPDGSWYCQTVDSEGDVGQYSSIAAAAGGVNIAYHDATNGDLKWAESTDYPYHQIWRIRTVDRGEIPVKTGLYTSLALPSYGIPRISYHTSDPNGEDKLRIARYVGGGGNCGYGAHEGNWRCETVKSGEGVGLYTSLVVDDDLYRYIVYYHAVDGVLWYATNRTGTNCGPGDNTWTCFPVSGGSADVGRYASLYVDSSHRFHIAYYDATNDALRYAVDVGGSGNCGAFGSAQCDEIDIMEADYHPLGISITGDGAGYPMIAYQGTDESLKLARPLEAVGLPPGYGNCGPEEGLFRTWICETVDPPGTWVDWRNGRYAAIDVSSLGLATIAYHRYWVNGASGNLMVAQQQPERVFLPVVLRVH